MSVNISHFLALTPHKLCEFLEIFKNIFQGPYLVKKEPISFWANMIWDFDLFSPTSTQWWRPCSAGLHALFQPLYKEGLIIRHQEPNYNFKKHH